MKTIGKKERRKKMSNQIERDAFVKRDVLKNPIPYTRGTDLLPIVIHFRDFQIPSGATARVFVAKADGNAVYTTATIDGNDVTVDVTDQMFIELGMALMQISIMDGEEELVSFVQPVDVKQNLKAGDFTESITDVSFLDDAIEQANEAVNTATAAAQQAATAVQNANTAVSNANAAIEELNEQIASLNNNFATLAQTVSISQLQTTAKNLVGAVNELNSKMPRDTNFVKTYSAVPGWIRVAKYNFGTIEAANGNAGYGGLIIYRTVFSNKTNEFSIISFNAGYNNSSFEKIASNNIHLLIKKIRHTVDINANTAYIELYIEAMNSNNRVNISMPCNVDGENNIAWMQTNGESTDETVEGVKVVSSLDLA